MATLASLTQVVSGNPVYENFYRRVDPENTGKVGPTEAALFLKKSGLPDSTLGKIWDLADPEGKGYLDKQGFYVALRLVACAQSGQEVSVSSINQTVPPPQFKDTSSPSLSSTTSLSCELLWAVKVCKDSNTVTLTEYFLYLIFFLFKQWKNSKLGCHFDRL
ncbi:epidermal growth factor receptor substrate 15-like 1 [Poecilia latipinna]|uniref:epidermal growth factor receptor substrate 15-like 1 n=1 Tax=Poecilia latipinna TaxID=48699 RepID=UPI00072EBB16|nr:PREDICTED: epidermal growth factor receptor substrate 15-like 1 [Poecilia latipinna]